MRQKNLQRTLKSVSYGIFTIFLIGSYFFFKQIQKEYLAITTFEECLDAGYSVIPTYPEQCKIPGKVFTNTHQVAEQETKEVISLPEKNMNPKNTSYDIEGKTITLQNGEATTTGDSASSSKKITYFGNELRFDIDNDTKEDSAFLLTVKGSHSEILYYLVAALNKDGGYAGTNGVLLGDRIAPQTTEFKNGEIVVNYADRKPDESMSVKPSIGVSRYFKVENNTLIEIQK